MPLELSKNFHEVFTVLKEVFLLIEIAYYSSMKSSRMFVDSSISEVSPEHDGDGGDGEEEQEGVWEADQVLEGGVRGGAAGLGLGGEGGQHQGLEAEGHLD